VINYDQFIYYVNPRGSNEAMEVRRITRQHAPGHRCLRSTVLTALLLSSPSASLELVLEPISISVAHLAAATNDRRIDGRCPFEFAWRRRFDGQGVKCHSRHCAAQMH
jgi:hypothetical protein